MVTVEPQITEGRVAHTGSAFLPLVVTAPTDVCLNWALIHEEITSPLKSPPTPPLTPMLLKYPSLLCKKRKLSPWRLHILPLLWKRPVTPLISKLHSCLTFSYTYRTSDIRVKLLHVHLSGFSWQIHSITLLLRVSVFRRGIPIGRMRLRQPWNFLDTTDWTLNSTYPASSSSEWVWCVIAQIGTNWEFNLI